MLFYAVILTYMYSGLSLTGSVIAQVWGSVINKTLFT